MMPSRDRGLSPVDADGSTDFNRDIVEESDGTEPGRNQQAGGAVQWHRSKCRIAHLQIIHFQRRHLRQHSAGRLQRGVRTTGCGMRPGQQRRRQHAGQFALGRIEVAVARRHRQAI